jgi:hypothetical protein
MLTSPLTSPGRLGAFLLIGLELALIGFVVLHFDIEPHKNLFPVLCLAGTGFLIHAWLPRRWQLGFFVLLSLAGIVLVLGWPNAAWLLAAGCGLVALCYVPAPQWLRVLLAVAAGLVLAFLRLGSLAPFWPILGSMFMFRLIVYLHQTRHERGRTPLGFTLAYFFPLPNICFTLFPVLDFKTFRDVYYNDEDHTLYQTGVAWMVRGLSHLLAYRFVKYYLLPEPHRLGDPAELALFLASNYALYLRVSGWFHFITGFLHLFGFNLPRTHHNYFLASSFTDIWRRINIYWKDFMTNVFFFPSFFGLRRWGTRGALVAGGMTVFVATWLLHSYQVFWLLGDVSLQTRDAVLWLTVGLLATINLQFDLRRTTRLATAPRPVHFPASADPLTPDPSPLGGRGEEEPSPLSAKGGEGPGVRERLAKRYGAAALRSLQILAMFTLVSFFWACWTVPGFINCLHLATVQGGEASARAGAIVLGVILAVMFAGVLLEWGRHQLAQRGWLPLPMTFARSVALHGAALVVLALAGLPQLTDRLGEAGGTMVATLRKDAYTPAEAGVVARGYYEEIAEAPIQAGPLLGALARQPRAADEDALYTEISRPTDDLLERELIPGWSGKVVGSPLTINELGMRDRKGISKHKPANTCRIALIGSSVVMGYGVTDDQVFGRLLEDRLNDAAPPGGPRYEVLNFGTGMSYAIQRRVLVERKVFAFEPDVVMYFAHQDELVGPPRHLAKLVAHKTRLPYPFLDDVVRKAGVTPEQPQGSVEAALQRFAPDIVVGIYQGLTDDCRKCGVIPVWVYLPIPGVVDSAGKSPEIVRVPSEAGFVILNLAKWADGYEAAHLKLTPTDYHANAVGHRLIALRLFEAIQQRPEVLPANARLR